MNKFRKKLASVVLSTSVLAGGVTTCLINSSTVDYCKATTPEEEMKSLLKQALCFVYILPHNKGIPQGKRLTAGNFKETMFNIMHTFTTPEEKMKIKPLIKLVNFVIIHIMLLLDAKEHVTVDSTDRKLELKFISAQKDLFDKENYCSLSLSNVKEVIEKMSEDYRKAFWNLFPEDFENQWLGVYRYEDIQANSIIAFLPK